MTCGIAHLMTLSGRTNFRLGNGLSGIASLSGSDCPDSTENCSDLSLPAFSLFVGSVCNSGPVMPTINGVPITSARSEPRFVDDGESDSIECLPVGSADSERFCPVAGSISFRYLSRVLEHSL